MILFVPFLLISFDIINKGNCFIVGQITCDNKMDFYADGVLIKTNDNWPEASTVTLPDTTTVLAFFCEDTGNPGGIKGFFSNGIKTDGTWRCIEINIHGWEDPSFDESTWPLAVLPNPAIWGRRPLSLFGQSDWIWTAGGNADKEVYCRKRIPVDERCPDMISKLESLTSILDSALLDVIVAISGGFGDVNSAVQNASTSALDGSILTLEQIDRDLIFILKQLFDD